MQLMIVVSVGNLDTFGSLTDKTQKPRIKDR